MKDGMGRLFRAGMGIFARINYDHCCDRFVIYKILTGVGMLFADR